MYITNTTGGLMLQTMLYLANFSGKLTNSTNEISSTNDVDDIKCYGVYGCFPIDEPWNTNARQINVYPESPSQVKPRFPVFTGRNLQYPHFIDLNDPESVHNFGINPFGKIFLISHGYLEAGDRPWLRDMAKALLDSEPEGSATVIIIDWGAGSSPPYVQAVANIRLVGAIAAHVIHLLYEELALSSLDRVHIIGHSLGAHLAGYTGYTLQRDFGLKLGRITGLDPAEPLFGDTDALVRLDKSDAKFVDILHTDATPGGLGIIKSIGHVDFYPNGGYDNPGCRMSFRDYMNKGENSFFWSMQEFVGCNHVRSHEYFIESIYKKCPFLAITCDSYESFKAGNCFKCNEDGHHCLRFGYDSEKGYNQLVNKGIIRPNSQITAYFMTGSEHPFCRVHYKVTVKMSSSHESLMHGGEIGTLSLQFHSLRKAETEVIPFSSEPIFFEPGLQYTSVIAGKDIGEIAYATATWNYKTNLLNPLTWRILASPRIYVEYITVELMEQKLAVKLCSVNQSPVIEDSPSTFRIKYCPKEHAITM